MLTVSSIRFPSIIGTLIHSFDQRPCGPLFVFSHLAVSSHVDGLLAVPVCTVIIHGLLTVSKTGITIPSLNNCNKTMSRAVA